ncbi:hypothetical protein E1262_04335 [Jiangella aurantiaca]|uniref:Nuclear transport factor 2 family protein n=1 Tax=Jiangella aurantiaca TaxID=2530373 RepID=A0A4R5ANU9_9ACTN|nr:hypothetical protein [Jiangella aurantiaca]TDD71962.1 hypothetical protein E1262_04335 [Jiangella aurantiaca]
MTPARVVVSTLAAAGLVLAAAACSGESEEPTGLETSAATAAPTTTEDPDAAAVAEIEAQYQRYWDIVIASENELDESYEELKTVATELIAQTQVADVRGLVDTGVTRDGAPVLGPPQVTVDGDTARVESCVDEDGWNVYQNGEPLERELLGPRPRVFDLERVDGQWLVSERVDQSEATITC